MFRYARFRRYAGISASMAYEALSGTRGVLVRLLGMSQEGVPRRRKVTAETLPMTPGQRASIFTVRTAQDECYWLTNAED